jgi:hypothetical protein
MPLQPSIAIQCIIEDCVTSLLFEIRKNALRQPGPGSLIGCLFV